MENINELNPQRQKKAKEYAKINRRFMILDLIIGIAFLLAWLLFDWSMELRNWTLILTTNNWLGIAAFGAVFGAAFYVINLPLSYYTGYIIPHRYEMSNQTIRGWLEDQVKSLLISIILGGLLLEIIYAVLRAAPETWWLWVGGIMLLFNVVLANLAPVLIFPLFYDFSPLGEEHADLAARLVQLAEQAGTHIKGVFKFDMSRRSKAANAGLTGLGSTRRIILGDTLLDEFSADEIETILAHELGHHVNKDIPIGMVIQTALTLGGLYLASVVLDWGVGYFDFHSVADIAALPLFGLVMGAYGLVTMPLGNGYSRWRERLADAYALEVTGKGEAYASALKRLADQNLADADPELWIEWLLHSHPALSKRIAMAKSNQKR